MSHPVVVFRQNESVERIVNVLTQCKHNGFPVVSDDFDPTVRNEIN